MSVIINGDTGITTPGVTDTGTLSVTGVTTLTGGLNAALPVLSGGTGVTTKTGTGAVVLGTSPTLTTPTFDSASLATISGTAPLYMCRAWVNFNGTGTVAIRGSGNVSSITDVGIGNYTVNFTTDMTDANYSAIGSSNYGGATITGMSNITVRSLLTTSCGVSNQFTNGSVEDVVLVCVSIFR